MAFEQTVLDMSFPAAEDLSNDQYRLVVLTSAGTVRRPDSETEVALGILQNAPASGEAASVRILGVSKLVANDAIGIGTFVMQEYVSATDAGKGKTSAGAPAYSRAVVLQASGAEDDMASVLLTSTFPAINDAVAIADPGNAGAISVKQSGVCAMTSAGAETRTIAIPAFIGQEITLIDDTHVGNIVVTAAAAINQTGNTVMTFGAAADFIVLKAATVGGSLVWRVAANDGVALSTP